MREKSVQIMLEELRFIKLKPKARSIVDEARKMLQDNGNVPLSVVSSVRKVYKSYSKRLKEVAEARENGRKSIARSKMGITSDEAKSIREKRLDRLVDKLEDLGF